MRGKNVLRFSALVALLLLSCSERGQDAALQECRRELAACQQSPQSKTVQDSPASFSAPIVYVQPDFKELQRRFDYVVSGDYDGRKLDPIDRCQGVSKQNRDVAFEYVHLDRYASTDEALAEMDKKGLRPALYEELLGFAEKFPDEQRKFPIAALGSEARVDGDRRVACLWHVGHGRRLSLHWSGDGWRGDGRFLAVRK